MSTPARSGLQRLPRHGGGTFVVAKSPYRAHQRVNVDVAQQAQNVERILVLRPARLLGAFRELVELAHEQVGRACDGDREAPRTLERTDLVRLVIDEGLRGPWPYAPLGFHAAPS